MEIIFINYNTEITDYNPVSDKEPQDLYRNMEQVQMIDIQYYNKFVTTDCNDNIQVSKIHIVIAFFFQNNDIYMK